mmetsp:Transcript_71141/g.87269  ORF Transcript_71141/g.87269 Transcript_71141/m.87269 type:complete len:142 (-) Transcript_71141:94-519(-)
MSSRKKGSKSNKNKSSKTSSKNASEILPTFKKIDKISKIRLKHFINRDYNWEKDEISWIIYWFRQVISLIFGILWGILPIQGLTGILLYLATSFMVLEGYTRFLNVDEQIFDKLQVLKEGFAPALGTFLLMWIMTYSLVFF